MILNHILTYTLNISKRYQYFYKNCWIRKFAANPILARIKSLGLSRTAAMMTGLMSGCVRNPTGSLRGLGTGVVESMPISDRRSPIKSLGLVDVVTVLSVVVGWPAVVVDCAIVVAASVVDAAIVVVVEAVVPMIKSISPPIKSSLVVATAAVVVDEATVVVVVVVVTVVVGVVVGVVDVEVVVG